MPARSEKQHRCGRGCRIGAWIGTLLVAVGLFGCSRFHAFPDASDPAAEHLFRQLRQINDGLKTFKGLGRLNLQTPSGVSLRKRVVWAGAFPANLRIEILEAGQSVVKIAADGEFLTVVDLAGIVDPSKSFHKFRITDPDLERMISISIKTSDMVALLAGRVPVVDYDAIRFGSSLPDRYVLELGRRWTGAVQKVDIERNSGDVFEVTRFERDGGVRYRAILERQQTAGSYRVPTRLILAGAGDARFSLEIDRYWPDAAVTPDMFRLEKPGGRPASN